MKVFLIFILLIPSLSSSAKNVLLFKKSKNKKTKTSQVVDASKNKPAEAPCDSKEDVLKKLEEKKKVQNSAVKGFSLQGGDTGCSVK